MTKLCRKLLSLPIQIIEDQVGIPPESALTEQRDTSVAKCVSDVDRRNAQFFDEEVAKLDRWADDLKLGLEAEIKELDKQIREARRGATLAVALTEKLAAQREVKEFEGKRNKKRRELFAAQDAVDSRRDELITNIEKQLRRQQALQTLFTIRWELH